MGKESSLGRLPFFTYVIGSAGRHVAIGETPWRPADSAGINPLAQVNSTNSGHSLKYLIVILQSISSTPRNPT
jgi:hypothetical protein